MPNNTTRRICCRIPSSVQPRSLARKPPRQTAAANEPSPCMNFFPSGFRNERIKTSGAEINAVIGGSGPPVLLFHGAPQSLITWRLIAPDLAKDYTLVMCDLRGYGDSSKPADGPITPANPSVPWRWTAYEVMEHLGYRQFLMVGHDRGGRVGRRMALDHPDRVQKLVVMDIVPAHYLYSHVTLDFVQAYFHWFNFLRQAPGPENELKTMNEAMLARATNDVQQEYLRNNTNPLTMHAHVRGLPRLGLDRSGNRCGGHQGRQEDPVPAADFVGRQRRHGQAL